MSSSKTKNHYYPYYDTEDLDDWGVSNIWDSEPEETSLYPAFFSSYTQAVACLDIEPRLIIETLNNLDEKTGNLVTVYMVRFPCSTDLLPEKY